MKNTSPNSNSLRPPIVSVLGHVDHGKTTLLDAIRKSNVATRESGGITQKIGASIITTKDGKRITFVDTPGHAVFNKMRSLGTSVADIVVLVVAADDGIKPQTKEALEYIKDSGVSYLVALTKTDLPSAAIDKVKRELAEASVPIEGYGGDVPVISLSAKTGEGIQDLLEMIPLISEVNNISGDPSGDLEAYVIETTLDKRGSLVSVVVKNGSLKIGDEVIAVSEDKKGVGEKELGRGRVKGLFGENGVSIKSVLPGEAARVLGFSSLPVVGSKLTSSDTRSGSQKKEKISRSNVSLEKDSIPVIIKAKSSGSLQAIESHLPEKIVPISVGVGDVSESDVFLAKSSQALIVVFEAKIPSGVSKLARTEGVKIETFSIIYKLFEHLDDIIKGREKEVLGEAEILAEFTYNKQRVAGSRVKTGRISSTDSILLLRKGEEIGNTKIKSMRKEKKEVNVVKQGEEFGVVFAPYLDFKTGDVIVSVRK